MKRLLTAAVLVTAAMTTHAQQWDGVVTGKISVIDVTGAENYGFRVFIGGQQMCAGGSGFAFLNKSDDNYKAYVSVLMMAKAMEKTVVIFSKMVSGQCQIGYVSMQG
ncbi:hypothetical protein [Roseateles aquatilis]|nr:hypothetical protein [Roseateles aquatilis]